MTQANLSEILLKPKFKHPETSTLVPRMRNKVGTAMHIPQWQVTRPVAGIAC